MTEFTLLENYAEFYDTLTILQVKLETIPNNKEPLITLLDNFRKSLIEMKNMLDDPNRDTEVFREFVLSRQIIVKDILDKINAWLHQHQFLIKNVKTLRDDLEEMEFPLFQNFPEFPFFQI